MNGKTIKLSNGVEMPVMSVSTLGKKYKLMKDIVVNALKNGFRAFDTARDYGNEPIVGQVIHDSLKELGIKREDIFITTKMGNSQQRLGNIDEQIEKSLKNLCTDYVDLWLMHWPYPDFYIDNYHKMEKVYNAGKVRAIGIANSNISYLEKLFENMSGRGGGIVPHAVQIECHPLRTMIEFRQYCKEHDIVVQAYSPVCRMIDTVRTSPILLQLAQKHNKTVGQIILRWHIQQGTVPVFDTNNPLRLKENSDIFDFELTGEEMERINSMNQNYKWWIESIYCPGY